MSESPSGVRSGAADEGRDAGIVGSAPRITIEAFCGSPETLASLQAATADRRLARTQVTLHSGGLAEAAHRFSQTATPNLLILESNQDRQRLLEDLGGLAEVCDPTTKVILIGHVNDVILYRELMRQGVSEYLVSPVEPIQVIEAILHLFTTPNAAPLGRTIAFLGCKGGVGSSTIAHNVGWEIAESLAEQVIIADFDLAFGTASLNFNLDPLQGLAEALNAPERVDDLLIDRLLTKCTDHLSLLASPAQVDRDYHVTPHAVDVVFTALRSSVPRIIADLPSGWSGWVKEILVHADDVVITATPDLACLRNTKNIVDHLRYARPNDRPPRLVLNQVGVHKRPEISTDDFLKSCGLAHATIMHSDPQTFTTAANNGQMLSQLAPSGKAAETIRDLAILIAGRKPPVKQSRFSLRPFMARLPRKKKAR